MMHIILGRILFWFVNVKLCVADVSCTGIIPSYHWIFLVVVLFLHIYELVVLVIEFILQEG